MSTRWCAPACCPTQASSGGGCGRRPRIRRSNCAHPTAARGWRIRWRSPRSIALNADLTAVSRAVVVEHKWRAQRYGIHGTFVDEAGPRGVPFARWLDQVIEEAAGDAAALGCLDEVLRCRAIVADGTSADAQLRVYRQARDKGAEREEALAAVNQWLAGMTLGWDDPGQPLRPRTSYLRPPAAGIHPEEPVLHVPRAADTTGSLSPELF